MENKQPMNTKQIAQEAASEIGYFVRSIGGTDETEFQRIIAAAADQIAAEAATKCAALIPISFGVRERDFEPIIKSVIEKRDQQWEQYLKDWCDRPSAAEAATECSAHAYDVYRISGKDTHTKFSAIIQTAIEKAVTATESRCAGQVAEMSLNHPRAAHASELWTVENFGDVWIVRIGTLRIVTSKANAVAICDAHNAAIISQREQQGGYVVGAVIKEIEQ